MDTSGWNPVTDASGKVLGWMPGDSPEFAEYLRAQRARHVEARAAAVDQAAELFGDPAFDIAETYDAADAAMPRAMTDAAAHVALMLREVELSGGDPA